MPYIENQGSVRQKAMMTLMSVTPVCNLLEDDPELQKATDVLGTLLHCAIAATAEEVVLIFEDIVAHPDVSSREDILLNARQTALIAVKENAEEFVRSLYTTDPADVRDSVSANAKLALANHVISVVALHIRNHQFQPRNGIPLEQQNLRDPIEVSCSICGYATALESPASQEWMLYSAIHSDLTESGEVILPQRTSPVTSSDVEEQDVSEWADRGLHYLNSPVFNSRAVPCPPSLKYLKAREDKKISEELLESLIATGNDPSNVVIEGFFDGRVTHLREDSAIFHNHVNEVLQAVNDILEER